MDALPHHIRPKESMEIMVSDYVRDDYAHSWRDNDLGIFARGPVMLHNPPYKIFGLTLWACHGIPAMFFMFCTIIAGLSAFEVSSQMRKPVELTAIWAEPHRITVDAILAQDLEHGALHLHKAGFWNRLCSVTAEQTFLDEHGAVIQTAVPHKIDTPEQAGAFSDKLRPQAVFVPKQIAQTPGIYRFKISNAGSCWWLEKSFPFLQIKGMTAEAIFEVVKN